MSEDSFIQLFRSRWHEIAGRLWPQTPRERAQAELEHLEAELARRQTRQLNLRKRIEKLHHCLERRKQRLALLAALVQKTPGDVAVVAEWERRRRTVDRLRERLQERERCYARRLALLRQGKLVRNELRERLLSGSLPMPVDEESDPDYPF